MTLSTNEVKCFDYNDVAIDSSTFIISHKGDSMRLFFPSSTASVRHFPGSIPFLSNVKNNLHQLIGLMR